MIRWALLLFLPVSGALAAPTSTPIDFGADYYSRDLSNNTLVGKGNAWVKQGTVHLTADQIEVDLNSNRATASGNVHVIDRDVQIWSRHADYNLNGKDALLDEATVLTGAMVIEGSTIRKLDETHFELTEGSYSNCNVSLTRAPEVARCDFDWKISGARINVEMGEYAHVYDGILFMKGLPLVYVPYAIFPIKTVRQTGLLPPYGVYYGNLGSGITFPVFLALGKWHDLLIQPTYFSGNSSSELYTRLDYRYIYSADKRGTVSWAFSSREFNPDLTQPQQRFAGESPILGFYGEWMVNLNHIFRLGERHFTRQTLHLVSNPVWSTFYPDLPAEAGLGYARSQVSYSHPGDGLLFTASAQYHQSLLVPEDSGSDGGAVAKLPELFFGKTAEPLWTKYLSYEFRLRTSNFFRAGSAFDNVPTRPLSAGPQPDTNFYDSNDYIRTGQRIILEPQLTLNVPLTEGIQLTPSLLAGSLLYHFDTPSSTLLGRQYLETEIPLSLYLTKRFSTPIPGLEEGSHVLQPRAVFVSNLFHDNSETDPSFQSRYPFFYEDGQNSAPRFDSLDRLTPHQYVRFELINRLRRKTASGIHRFLFLKVSQQLNLRTFANDPRYTRRLGPLEILSELTVWRFRAQLQASYGLEKILGEREAEWSGALNYQSPEGDNITAGILMRQRRDRSLTEQTVTLSGLKRLPLFFDLSGNVEYSAKKGELVSYGIGLHFAEKPRSCWALDFTTGRDAYRRPFAQIRFNFNFGNPSGYPI